MRLAIGSTAVAALVLVASIDAAHACSCLPPRPPLEELAARDAVFSGIVLSQVLDPTGMRPLRFVKFEVSNCWKGGITGIVEVSTRSDEAACGRSFTDGIEYLVYASVSGNELHTFLCDRTRRMTNAQVDLAALGPPTCTTAIALSTWSSLKRLYD
jgi:hypothetical protein